MGKYVVRRLFMGLGTLVGASMIIFFILRIIPGDAALMILTSRSSQDEARIDPKQLQELREQLGTNRPLYVQYGDWIKSLATGNLGVSLFNGTSVAHELRIRFPFTFQLALLSVLFASVVGVSLGLLAAFKRNTMWDYVARVLGIAGITLPVFWSATLMIFFLVYFFKWIPPLEFEYLWKDPGTAATQLVWPTVALGYYLAGVISRITRAQALEILRQDYIRTAYAKGLSSRVVVVRHALRNAMLPVVTIIGLQFAALLSGTVLVEAIFHIPGLGSLMLQGIRQRDYPVVQTLFILFAAIVIVANLTVDILYSVLDPRIRYS